MALDKYRYHIYPDRIYVIQIDPKTSIEIRGFEIASILGLDSYYQEVDKESSS